MIHIDNRSGSAELFKPLVAMGLPACLERFDAADLAFEGRGVGGAHVLVGIEFKQVNELVQALRTERLQGHQMRKMRDTYDYSWLIIEGEAEWDKAGQLVRKGRFGAAKSLGMGISELLKRVTVLQVSGGLTPWWTQNRAHTLKVIEALYRMWTDVAQDEHKSHIAIYHPAPLVPVSDFRRAVAAWPNIGFTLSKQIEDRFVGSLRAAVNATPETWEEIEGIGPKTARGLQEFFA